ncbi:MAG: methionyl-tRNA formyltransferase, partial [Deltaproteobacteria bacterium]|nr:methionyl-tRNA formyltransferase [Deltaproteobacteria bacterium]
MGKVSRIIFAGTPVFAVPSLEALIEAGHNIIAVLTRPDKPRGRGLATVQSPVKETALRY